MFIQKHGCDIISNDKRCDKETIITLDTSGQIHNLCKNHYRAKVVDILERERSANSCNLCKSSIMEYLNVTCNESGDIKAWYKCLNPNCRFSVGYRRILKDDGTIE